MEVIQRAFLRCTLCSLDIDLAVLDCRPASTALLNYTLETKKELSSVPYSVLVHQKDKQVKKRISHRLALSLLIGLSFSDIQAAVSITAYNTGELAGTWGGKEWHYVTGHALWQQQNESPVQVSCTAVLGCALAVGTVNGNKFYPRYGFINIPQGATWEDAYSGWLYQHGTEITFKFPEPVERLSASNTCGTIALYWNKDQDGGYQQWQPIPGSQCAPIGRQ
ncbi:TPA: hypothetical protein SMF37_002414 [Serratia marcescens]|nr:hypothetical protein [Serratia marcescens]